MTKRMDADEKIAYLQSLLAIIKHIIPENTMMPANTSAFIQTGQSGFAQQRFRLILDSGKVRPARTQIASVALIVMVFVASFLVIIQPAYKLPNEDIKGAHTINNENTYILVTNNNTYELYIDGKFVTEISETSIEQNNEFKKLPRINEGEIIE